MLGNIEPTVFARIMSLPNSVRHDVLEFIGSTPVASKSIEQIVASVTERQGPGQGPRKTAAN